jgi:hypothetical protein
VAFGLALIANTQLVGDGGWYWYAFLLRSGQRLYADMHLVLQPLFVLETAWSVALFGKGWLASRVLATLYAIAYSLGLLLVLRDSRASDRQNAVVLACAFFLTLNAVGYRFDDYHVPADTCLIYSLVLLLMLERSGTLPRVLCLAAALGVLSGLAMMTRLTDGAALFLGVGISILCLAASRKLISVLLFITAAALTVISVVKATGDSFHTYATTSIFGAAGSKGGTGSVLLNPILLPWNTLRWIKNLWRGHPVIPAITLYFIAVAAAWVFLLQPFLSSKQPRNVLKLIAGIALILVPLYGIYPRLLDVDVLQNVIALSVYVVYGLGILAFARLLHRQFHRRGTEWDCRQILLIIPLGLLAATAMSSAGSHWGISTPAALTVLLIPVVTPIHLKADWTRSFLLAIAALLACYCAVYKSANPYAWHSYQSRPLFVGRQWYRHPVYGPMIIETEQLHFIQPMCDDIERGGSEGELLSLPNAYPNYFCSIPPWHGYVQTFFDTSSSATIYGLMDELEKSPPKWIVYQRQLNNLLLHESTYNQGKPLPHRYLDRLIEARLASGAWQSVYTSSFSSHGFYANEWILIRTRQ